MVYLPKSKMDISKSKSVDLTSEIRAHLDKKKIK